MAYEYEKSLKNRLLNLELDDYVEVIQLEKEYEELEEVYAKAKAFDEINIILDKYLGNVEDELNALNLIREKLEGMEDK